MQVATTRRNRIIRGVEAETARTCGFFGAMMAAVGAVGFYSCENQIRDSAQALNQNNRTTTAVRNFDLRDHVMSSAFSLATTGFLIASARGQMSLNKLKTEAK